MWMRRRRRKKEPIWPLLLVLSLAAGGVGVGVLLVEEQQGELPARALEPVAADPPPSVRERVRVEVLNAGGIAGVAGDARDVLREAGFDVVHFGNAGAFGRDTSLVLVRTGMHEAGREVAATLGIERVDPAPDSTVFADLTVLLGTDWSRASPEPEQEFKEGGEPSRSEAPWWDLRRFLRND